MLICDTSGLFAYFGMGEPDHDAVASAISDESGPLIVSDYVLAELDYLVTTREGSDAALACVRELGGGGWELSHLSAQDIQAAADVMERYRDQPIGLTDASAVVLAERHGTDRIVTLDRRHFSVLRTSSGRPFTLLP